MRSKTMAGSNPKRKNTYSRTMSPVKTINIKKNPGNNSAKQKIIKKDSSEKIAREWQEIFDVLNDAICLLDKDQRIVRANRAMHKIFGMTNKKLTGRSYWKIVHGTSSPFPDSPVTRTKKSLKPEEMELPARERTFHVTAYPVLNDKNILLAIVCILRDITEHKQSDKQLQTYFNQLQSINKNLADGMVYQINSGKDGTKRDFTYLSPAVERLHHLKVEDVLNDASLIYKQVVEEDVGLLLEAENQAFRNKTKLDLEVRIKMPSGEVRWSQFLSVPGILPDGDFLWDGIEIDITERKKAEIALRESERKYKLLAEKMSDIVWIMDMNLKTTYVSPSIQRVLGFTQDERLNQTVEEQLTPDSLSIALRILNTELALEQAGKGDPQKTETLILEFYHKNHSTRWLETTVSGLRNEKGFLTGIHGVSRDITGRKQAEEALKERDIVFKKLSAHVPGMIYQFMIKPDGTRCIPFSTGAIKNIFGCSPENVLNDYTPIINVIFPEDRDEFIASIEDSARHMTDWKHEYRVQLPGGPVRWMLGQSTPEKLPDGTIIWHGFNADITAQKEAQKNLEISQDNYRRLFEDHSAVKLIIDPQSGFVLDANHAACDFYGWTQNEMKQMKIWDINTLSEHQIKQEIDKALREKRVHFEFRHRRADGSVRDVEVYSSGIEMNGKNVLHSIIHDITERKKAEESLLITQFSVDRASFNLLWLDEDANIVYANDAAITSLGYTQDELLKMKVFDVDPEFQSEQWLPHKNELRKRRSMTFESQHRRKDGSIFPVEVTCNYFEFKGRFYSCAFDWDITERKQAEEALRRSELMFRRLFENSPVGVSLIRDREFVEVNPALCEITGYTAEELIGRPVSILYKDEEEYERIGKIIYDEVAKQGVGISDARSKRKNGEVFDCLLYLSLIDPEDRSSGYQVILLDISARKQAEDALSASEERFRTLTEQSSDIIVLISRDGKIIYENPAVEKILGLKLEDRTNKNVFDNVHPDDSIFFSNTYKTIINGEPSPVKKAEIRIRDINNNWRTFEIVGSVQRKGDLIDMIIVNLRDITERKFAEQKIMHERDFSQAVIDTMPGLFYMFDDQGRFLKWNKNFRELSGYSDNELTHMTPIDVVHESEREMGKEALRKVFAGEFSSIEAHFLSKNGKTTPYLFTGTMLEYEGRPCAIGMAIDISERIKAEEEIRTLNELLEERVRERTTELEAFSYSVSHDLRAPLRTIDGFGLALMEDYGEKLDTQAKDYLNRIRAATGTMAELIEDMLKLFRITRTEMDILQVNLSNIAESITNELQKSQPERRVNIKIVKSMEDSADPRLIRIVLENLIGNAWKFTEKKSNAEIEFGAIEKDDKKVYFVRDNGAGFDMDYASKLFAPFQRLHNIDEYPGTGIGLAIIKRIIARHEGTVSAEGTPDQGATFYFTLK